jgi:hypothetical protein
MTMPYIAYSRAILGVFYELLFLSAKANKARAKEINQYIFIRRENFRYFLVIWLAASTRKSLFSKPKGIN